MSNVNCRRAYFVVKFDYFATHRKAQFCVEIGQRLVHHKDGYVLDNRSAERNALHLSSGEFFGKFVEIRAKIENFRRFVNLFTNFVRREHTAFYPDFTVVVEHLEPVVVLLARFVQTLLTLFDHGVKRLVPRCENSRFFILVLFCLFSSVQPFFLCRGVERRVKVDKNPGCFG